MSWNKWIKELFKIWADSHGTEARGPNRLLFSKSSIFALQIGWPSLVPRRLLFTILSLAHRCHQEGDLYAERISYPLKGEIGPTEPDLLHTKFHPPFLTSSFKFKNKPQRSPLWQRLLAIHKIRFLAFLRHIDKLYFQISFQLNVVTF